MLHADHPARDGTAAITASHLTFLVFVTILIYVVGHNALNSLYLVPTYMADGGLADGIEVISEGSPRRQVGYLILGACGLVVLFRRGLSDVSFRRGMCIALGLFLAWCTVSLLWADDPSLTFRRLAVFWLSLLGAAGVVLITPERGIPWYIALSGTAFILVGVATEIVLGTFTPWVGVYRFSGTLHANAQGINCAYVALAALWLAVAGTTTRRGLARILFAIAVGSLLLTKSRTSFVALLAAGISLLILQFHPRRRFVVVAALINVGILVFLLFQNGLLTAPFEFLFLGRGSADLSTLNSRVPLWTILNDYVAARPVLGYGYSGFMTPQHAAEIAVMLEFGIAGAHSIYLESMLGVGGIGLALLMAVFAMGLFTTVVPARYREPEAASFIAAILVFELLNGILDSSMLFPSWRIPILLVLLSLCMSPARRAPGGGAARR